MRRRTHKLGGNKTIIYIIVVVLLVAGNYLYDNFAPEQAEAAEIEEVEFTKSSAEAPAPKSKTAHAGWAELPTQKANNDIYITSHLLGDNRRNYTVCYSREQRAPLWVAAPVHRAYNGDVKRVDNYDFDPTLPVNIQITLNRSYGDYTRGHMLGSGERTATREMNNQTFYVTNIAPQLREGFNERGGAWNNLEYFVDRQLCADTLYVVTGAIYDDFTAPDGTNIKARTTVNKNDNKHIGVPTAYYKALLRTKSGRTGKSVVECKASELKCVAFIIPHRSDVGHKPTVEDMISIKELERLTGVNFFANVPNAPENKAEAKDWGL
jgi:DNA/RNA endonuclease G (NUC1)